MNSNMTEKRIESLEELKIALEVNLIFLIFFQKKNNNIN